MVPNLHCVFSLLITALSSWCVGRSGQITAQSNFPPLSWSRSLQKRVQPPSSFSEQHVSCFSHLGPELTAATMLIWRESLSTIPTGNRQACDPLSFDISRPPHGPPPMTQSAQSKWLSGLWLTTEGCLGKELRRPPLILIKEFKKHHSHSVLHKK